MEHKTRTKALSWLLSLALVLSLLPGMSLTALADGHDHSSWTAWESNNSLPTTAGNYYLTNDVTISSTWNVPGTTNLCLNGHGIRYNGSGKGGVITVGETATLNLYDCGTTKHFITLTGGRGTAVSDTSSAGAIEVTGGYITGGNCSDNDYSNSDSGVKVVEGGTFTMYGGTIIGNKAWARGGGVNNYGTFTMNGGLVTNNSATLNGGGVNNAGTFTMNGGSIEHNTAGNGGGVNISMGKSFTFTMSGGRITGNTADYGGGVWNGGTFTMSGGRITGNTANTNGGGVNNCEKFTMSGGSITGNTADYGGGVYNYGTLTMSGGTISGNTATSASGSPALRYDGGTLNIDGGGSKAVLVTTNTDGTGDKLAYSAANVNTYGYIAVVPTYRAATVNATTHAVSFTDETCTDYTTVTTGTTAWSDGWYVVSSDVTIDERITVTGTVNLILCDGKTLTASRGITTTDATLNIYAQSTGDNMGALIANAEDESYAAGIGGGENGNGGTVTIYGGTVRATGGPGSAGIGGGNGGNGGTTTIYGGTVIAAGASNDYGAGIGGGENGNGGTTTIYGGTVNATGGLYGAGIGGGKGGNGGSFAIYGGTVTATGGLNAGAGIGGGSYGSGITGSTVAIHGGQVTASGQSSFAAGIDCRKTSLTVSGGTVKATGGGSDSECMGIVGPISLDGMYLYGSDTTANPENDLSNYVPLTAGDYARTRYMTVNNLAPHNHTLTNYTVTKTHAANDTITAECNANGCLLPEVGGNHIATLTIAPKDDGTATLTGGADFGVTNENIQYSTDGGTSWDAGPTTSGFLQARIKVNDGSNDYYASIQYGVNSITYTTGLEHGTISGVLTGTVGAVITPTAVPDAGYALQQITVEPTSQGSTTTVEKPSDTSFTMPGEAVTVSATFRAIDYTVTVNSTTDGAVTASKTSGVHVGDEIALTVTPADGYAVDTITVKDASDQDVDVTNRAFTMPASNVTVNVTFAPLTTYTIFYRASGEPTSVLVRLSNSGDSVAMAPSAKLGGIDCWAIQVEAKKDISKLPVAFKVGDGEWSELNTEQSVVKDIPNNLDAGSAAVIEGEAKAFVVAFTWGDLTKVDGTDDSYLPAANSTKHFLVTNNTTSVSVPDPAKTGYTFQGWLYNNGADKTGTLASSDGKVTLTGIDETTIFTPVWKPVQCTVTYDLNGGSGDAPAATVNYGEKVTAPEAPTKSGYVFVRWVVADSATEKIGDNDEVRLSAGTAFDFSKTAIINDLKLKAEWKHVHSYVCLPLNHAAFGGAFASYVNAGYGAYMHIKICTGMDDYCAEAHSFGSNGRCACGATKPTPTVTLQKQIDGQTPSTTQVTKDSVVVLGAPNISGKTFSKWEYNDGQNWRSLTTSPYAAFVIPSNLQVKAEYSSPSVEVSIESFDYKGNIAFYFSYKVPDGYTVLDGGILFGNNSHLRYMLAKTPKETMDLSISGAVQYFAPIPSAVEAPVYYEVAKGDAVNKFGAANVATKMFREEALNVSGRSNPIFKKVSSLGKAGTAAIAVNTSADNIFYYGMGYVICKAPNGSLVAFKTNAIAATRGDPNHSASSSNPVQ